MITPQEIKNKAVRWWSNNSFLRSVILEESFFPRDMPQIGLVKLIEKVTDFLKISSEQQQLIKYSKEIKGFGYSMEWEERNHQSIGKNRFIKRIYFETEKDYIRFIGKETHLKNFRNDLSLVLGLPALKPWIIENPLKVVYHHGNWESILKVCMYFLKAHELNKYYIRELPIKVHTKFVENNKELLCDLLDFLLPEDKIIKEHVGTRNFEKRYGLKYEQPLIRIRILDECICEEYFSGFSDLSIPVEKLDVLDVPVEHVIILENKTNYTNIMNFLTIPKLKGAIAVFGSGNRVGALKNATWLSRINTYYWGDLDIQGFQILSQLRAFHPTIKSIMMDRKTLLAFEEDWVEGTPTLVSDPVNLTEEEQKLYQLLKEKSIRLEQEKISHNFVKENFYDKMAKSHADQTDGQQA